MVCAWASARPDAELTEETLRGQIAHFRTPKHVEIVEDRPMTITGEPRKFVMRDRMVEMFAARASG